MGIDLFLIAVFVLLAFAIFDLVVGVTNDAVNFLNSSIGSRVAPRYFIMIIASLGILAGVSFSSGMMEVARKGIFHPQFFTMPELMTIFLAVMLTDVILLDLFSTFGLPTSTTVSIVFELLGASVAVAAIKVVSAEGAGSVLEYINTGKALVIISGILLSIVVAFTFGAIVQFLSRLVFTFDYERRLKRYGGLWGGLALASITYFILIKGAKGATFITPETAEWIKNNSMMILLPLFAVSGLLLQVLLFLRVNILKPIVLVGTFALAMAFAANDLVNFIGVPMAGLQAYKVAGAGGNPLTASMAALGQSVRPESYLIILAGVIMVITLSVSKKARTVTMTEVGLGQQGEGEERFDSTRLSRVIVQMGMSVSNGISGLLPRSSRVWIARRSDPTKYTSSVIENRPPFDLLRASVNLMVASAVISYATSKQLPLSTTYVTFMVAMGSSFADQAWGRESAVFRVTGVLTVVGGWFMTALMAFTICAGFALVISYAKAYGVIALMVVAGLAIWRNNRLHASRAKVLEDDEIYNLRDAKDGSEAVTLTFKQVGVLLDELAQSMDATLRALAGRNEYGLRAERNRVRRLQRWANTITNNVIRSVRLLQREDGGTSLTFWQTVRRVQKLVDGQRDIVTRSYLHLANRHKMLLPDQLKELDEVRQRMVPMLKDASGALKGGRPLDPAAAIEMDTSLRELVQRLSSLQFERVRGRASKPRMSILFCAIVGNTGMISKQTSRLLQIYAEATGQSEPPEDLDVE